MTNRRRMRPRLLFAALALASAGPALATPADAIRSGDMQQMIPAIIAVYEDAGIAWDHRIEWKVGEFTTTFWYYSPSLDEIVAGAVPTRAEIDEYWQTWSEVLTDGNFDPASFFVSATEAEELARFNQYVLATHESAHAVTYRYDYAHLARHNDAINCREYYADRLTVAILNEEAGRDADMARWRERYRELVTAMGATIPAQYRYHIPDLAALEADCALIDVAQPTPEAMQPYASAYFERYRVLLEGELPPLAELLDTHLASHLREALARVPLAAEHADSELRTIARLDEMELGTVFFGLKSDDNSGSRAAAVAPDGSLWFATLEYDSAARVLDLAFGTTPIGSPLVVAAEPWHRPSQRVLVSSLAVLSADEFVVALEHFEQPGADDTYADLVTWVHAVRRDGAWTLTSLLEIDDMQQGAVLRSPDNRVFLLANADSRSRDPSPNWRGLEISLATGEVVAELPLAAQFYRPMAIDAEGRLYEEINYYLWRSEQTGRFEALIGNGLYGPRDGRGAKAELSSVQFMQWMADGSAVLVERGLRFEDWIRRELRRVAP
jgi:hypothetical protein